MRNVFREPKESPKVVKDLDAIVQESTAVTLHGNVHEIRPVLVSEFFALANAMASVKSLEKREKVTIDEIVSAYYGIISAVCSTITREDILKCTQSQLAALMQHIMDHITGGLTDEKKKTLTKMALPLQ